MKILFRHSLAEEGEARVATKHFHVTKQRTRCRDELVIGRYSVLPYYPELEWDLKNNGCELINTYQMHKWIADFEYYDVLKNYTPETWFDHDFCDCEYEGPFVVKGKTNSRKFNWNTQMFAPTKRDALRIGCELAGNELIGPQGIIYRKYVPLKTYETGLNGLPFTNEWRFFFYKQHLLSYGYYWTNALNILPNDQCSLLMKIIAVKIACIVRKHVNFFVLDIAEDEHGIPILIEVNDAQMSGLSNNDPEELYSNLRKVLND